MNVYEVPGDVKELFSNGETSYKIIDHHNEMNNVEAMELFLEYLGIDKNLILSNEETLVILCHPDFNFHVTVSSGGLGDFYSHGYDVEINRLSNYREDITLSDLKANVPDVIEKILCKNDASVTSGELKEIYNYIRSNFSL